MVVIDQPTPCHLSIKLRSHLLFCLKPFIWVTGLGCMRRVQILLAYYKEKNVVSVSHCLNSHWQASTTTSSSSTWAPANLLSTCLPAPSYRDETDPRWHLHLHLNVWKNCLHLEFSSSLITRPEEWHKDKRSSIPAWSRLDLDWACKHTHKHTFTHKNC